MDPGPKKQAYRIANREKRRVYNRAYEAANLEDTRAAALVRYHRMDKPILAFDRRLRRYNLTEEEFIGMQYSQNGLCACCGKPPSARGFVVDHNHTTGKVRGLLCNRCNSALGFLESPDRSLWEKYLEKSS